MNKYNKYQQRKLHFRQNELSALDRLCYESLGGDSVYVLAHAGMYLPAGKYLPYWFRHVIPATAWRDKCTLVYPHISLVYSTVPAVGFVDIRSYSGLILMMRHVTGRAIAVPFYQAWLNGPASLLHNKPLSLVDE